MDQEISFYQTPGPYTDPREFRQLLQSLPDDPLEIIRFIKKLLIHPVEAKNCGLHFNTKKALRSQADHRSVDDILTNPKVHALLSQGTLDFTSAPEQRAILSCDHHAVLFTAILQLKSRAARARCGYASYIVPGKLTPHWICEIYDLQKRCWIAIDPDQAALNRPVEDFISGGQAWLSARQGTLDLDRILPDYREGMDGIKYRLLNDVNALMKNELLSYEWMIREAPPKPPKLFSKPVSKLEDTEVSLLDRLAACTTNMDKRWKDIFDQYSTYVHAENQR